jgi:hypothetical protein
MKLSLGRTFGPFAPFARAGGRINRCYAVDLTTPPRIASRWNQGNLAGINLTGFPVGVAMSGANVKGRTI